MVMDFIVANTVEEWVNKDPSLVEIIRPMIDTAIKWLLSLTVPEDGLLGPVGGGIARHH